MIKTQKRPVIVVLLLGSNLSDRLSYLQNALAMIGARVGKVMLTSSIYETQPWKAEGHSSYYNQAISISTTLPPGGLMNQLLQIEADLGRTREEGITPRVIDIDMMFYGGRNINQKKLTIPHPRLHLRRFALIPLCEIIPGFVHPFLKKTLKVLLTECPDDLKVLIIESK